MESGQMGMEWNGMESGQMGSRSRRIREGKVREAPAFVHQKLTKSRCFCIFINTIRNQSTHETRFVFRLQRYRGYTCVCKIMKSKTHDFWYGREESGCWTQWQPADSFPFLGAGPSSNSPPPPNRRITERHASIVPSLKPILILLFKKPKKILWSFTTTLSLFLPESWDPGIPTGTWPGWMAGGPGSNPQPPSIPGARSGGFGRVPGSQPRAGRGQAKYPLGIFPRHHCIFQFFPKFWSTLIQFHPHASAPWSHCYLSLRVVCAQVSWFPYIFHFVWCSIFYFPTLLSCAITWFLFLFWFVGL